jgi:hypothetical protein
VILTGSPGPGLRMTSGQGRAVASSHPGVSFRAARQRVDFAAARSPGS